MVLTLSSSLSNMLASLGFVALSLSAVVSASPEPIALTSRKVHRGHSSGLRKRALKPVNVPLLDFFNQTDLQCVLPYLQAIADITDSHTIY